MKKVSLTMIAVLFTLIAVPLCAQENFTEGPISRIVLIHIKPGRGTEFWSDIRQNLKPIYEEYKKQGDCRLPFLHEGDNRKTRRLERRDQYRLQELRSTRWPRGANRPDHAQVLRYS